MSSGAKLVPQARGRGKMVKARSKGKGDSFRYRPNFIAASFRREIPGLVLTHHPGMTTESANHTFPNSSST